MFCLLVLTYLITTSVSVKQESPSPLQSLFLPDEQLGDLFVQVQLQSIFPTQGDFLRSMPLSPPAEILQSYNEQKNASDFNLTAFVLQNFELVPIPSSNTTNDTNVPVIEHINQLWPILTRQPQPPGDLMSSLIPLPNAYIVPGGQFQEVYYWDSFFIMLGLRKSGLITLIESIIDNFTYLINLLGHIPNGNRGFFMTRSQPPFYAMMVSLLAEEKGDEILVKYGPAIYKEYQFWMDGAENLTETNNTHRHVVRMPDGSLMNRYWDDKATPRPESYKNDYLMAQSSGRDPEDLYRNIRAACESGWDFTGRWFADQLDMTTIRTTELIPVDLNALIYNMELTLVKIASLEQDKEKEDLFTQKAEARKEAIIKYCWSDEDQYFYDYDFVNNESTGIPTLAAVYPLYFNMTEVTYAAGVANKLKTEFLNIGGLPTTLLNTTDQQWDFPNGWAPHQWLSIHALRNYNYSDLADTITTNWINLNVNAYNLTGKLVEKYNVTSNNSAGGGGEYPTQDGFGWTNGVLLDLMLSQDDKIII